jgi:hypothetical protein
MQDELFPDAPVIKPDMSKHGATMRKGHWFCRNWHGWYQSREVGQKRWSYYVVGFRDTTCDVLAFDDAGEAVERSVPIDSRNRITIDERKYSVRHWRH